MRKSFPNIPMRLCEVNPERYEMLEKTMEQDPNTQLFLGDCNTLIEKILETLPEETFLFFFIDPSGVRENGFDQLRYETVQKIAALGNSEVLLNFPLLPFTRWGAYCERRPEDPKSKKMSPALTRFYGSQAWSDYYSSTSPKGKRWNIEWLVNNYITSIQPYFKERVQKKLIAAKNSPQYYLLYGTNHPVGSTFMSKAFNKSDERDSGVNLDRFLR